MIRKSLGLVFCSSVLALLSSSIVYSVPKSGVEFYSYRNQFGFESNESIHDAYLDANGNQYVVGQIEGSSGSIDMLIMKIGRLGEVDTSFGNGGIITYDRSGLEDVATSISVNNQGDLFVGGYSTDSFGDRDITVLRLDKHGNFISDFAQGGIYVLDSGEGGDEIVGLDVLKDNSVVFNAWYANGSGHLAGVFHLSQSGELDESFGGDGMASCLSLVGGFAGDILVSKKNEIYATFSEYAGFSEADALICKFDSEGNVASDFGTDGAVALSVSDTNRFGRIAIDKTGNIYGLIHSFVLFQWPHDSYVVKVSDSGNLDESFGESGFFDIGHSYRGGHFDAADISISQKGQVYVSGGLVISSGKIPFENTIVTRMLSDAGIDESFGSSGFFVFAPEGYNHSNGVQVEVNQSNVYIVGNLVDYESESYGFDFGLWMLDVK